MQRYPVLNRGNFYAEKNSIVTTFLRATATVCYRDSMLSPVRPSVSVTWVDQSKRLKLGSCNFHHTVAPSI